MILTKDDGLGLTATSECTTLRWILLQENNNNFLNIFSLSHTCFQATEDASKLLYNFFQRNRSTIWPHTCVLFSSGTFEICLR